MSPESKSSNESCIERQEIKNMRWMKHLSNAKFLSWAPMSPKRKLRVWQEKLNSLVREQNMAQLHLLWSWRAKNVLTVSTLSVLCDSSICAPFKLSIIYTILCFNCTKAFPYKQNFIYVYKYIYKYVSVYKYVYVHIYIHKKLLLFSLIFIFRLLCWNV